METTSLHERLLAVAGAKTYRAIADLTNTNAETVRRYMQGQAPSVEFVSALCSEMGISAEWLLTGRGPMKSDQMRAHALKDASAGELLGAMAGTVEMLIERVERLEAYVHTLEARLRGQLERGSTGVDGKDDERTATTAGTVAARARSVAEAIAERPRPRAR